MGDQREALPRAELVNGWLLTSTPEFQVRERPATSPWESWHGWSVFCAPSSRVTPPSDPEADRASAALRVRARRMEALGDPFRPPWPAAWCEARELEPSELPWSNRTAIVQAAKRAAELGYAVTAERWRSTVNGETWRLVCSWPHGASGRYPIVFAARTVERDLQVAGVLTERSLRWLGSVSDLGETLAALGRRL